MNQITPSFDTCEYININLDMIKQFLVLAVVFALAAGKKNLKEQNKQKKKNEPKTVVESNHFYSNQDRNTTYDINSVEKNKSLIFILKRTDKKDKELKDNPITISLQSGAIVETCVFKSFNNMCGIKQVDQTSMKLKIQCKKLPCELSWVIYQPNIVTEDGSTQIQRFVEVNQNYDHASIILSCNDPNIKTFGKDIQLYTNSDYTKIQQTNMIYYLFDNEEKGYYFITTQNQGVRKCAHAVMKHSKDEVQFNSKDILQDFIKPGKANEYVFTKVPDNDFRIDAYFHQAVASQQLSEKQGLIVSLIGEIGSKKTNISSVTIDGQKKNSVDFSAVFKKPTEKYDHLLFSIQVIGKEILIISMNFASSQRQQVNLGESTYFKLNSGEKLNFKLLPQPQQTSETRLTHIFSSNQSKFTPSLKECKTKAGCEFTLQAKESGEGDLYFGEQASMNTSQIVYLDFNRTMTKKVREGQKIYLKTSIKQKKAVQFVVNSPNVIVYVARKQKCEVVSPQCYDKIFNFHNPSIYEPKADMDLSLMVEALDNAEFTITLIEEGFQFIELQDSQPFAYLFDDAEKGLLFKFKITKKMDAHFNLIGPVDELTLTVYNRAEVDDETEGEISNEGYVTFEKEKIDGLVFIVKVSKREAYVGKFIHFTLLASTKEGNVRLQGGQSHFQTIRPDETRDYVFQYQPSMDTLLNFYTHNIKNSQVNVLVQLSTTDQYKKDDQITQYTLDQESDVVDIQQVGKELCKQQAGENCQLFLRLRNKMQVEIDITITLMIKDSIIELKDGIWNSYQINSVAQSTNFYFLPKSKNRSITILYKSDLVDLKLMYTLWKTDDKSINPTQWPFPHQYKGNSSVVLGYSPTKFIHIDSGALKNCWPNCVILISTFKDQKTVQSAYKNYLQNGQFKILATSNFIEIPQKHKIDVILKKDQTKHLLIDLKYALGKQALTIFTYFTIGSVQLSGNVYEQTNPRCPTGDEASDFRFGNLQTQISVETIKRQLADHNMNLEKNPYICILAQAYLDSKFSIEYVSDDGLIKQLFTDNFYTHRAEAGKLAYFQIDGSQQFTVKITRTEGFPFVSHASCKSDDDFEECFQKFKGQTKQTQLADKMTTFQQQPCEKCIVFLKVNSPEASEVDIHVQSKYTQTQLIQNKMLTDQLQPKGQNKYLLTSVKNQEIIINIQITHGNLQVSVFDYSNIRIDKKNEKGSTNIHIVIPPKPKSKGTQSYGATLLGLFDYSTFSSLHMTIKSQNQSVGALYTVTYSSGEPEIYLQDGLISEYGIQPNKTAKFLYKNPTLSSIYLHISMADAQILNKLKVSVKAIADESDEDSATALTPEKPNFKKKTPNPTMIMTLPPNKFFQIQITNPDKSLQLVTIGINNRQIIYLPNNHQFPVQLLKAEYIYLVVNVPVGSYLNVQFKKCDQSTLSLGYTTSYQDFIKEDFSYQQEMGEQELITQLQIKTKQSGSAYIKVRAPDDDDSLLTVKASYSFIKNKVQKAKPGSKGLIEYRIVDAQNAQISFTPIVCPTNNKGCSKQFSYSSISSLHVEDVYAQLVCSSVSFDLADRQILHQVDSTPIQSANLHEGRVVFNQAIKESNEFVGVKAVNNKTGEIVYYKPLQIMTIWGQISKQGKSHGTLILSILASLLLCCLILVCYRRKKRNNSSEYAPLDSVQ